MSFPFALASAVGIVCPHEHPVGSIGKVVFHVIPVVGLEVCPVALRVNHPEVGFHAERFWQAAQQQLKIIDRGAPAQCLGHQQAFAVHLGNGVVLQVIYGGVHHGKSTAVVAYPRLAAQGVVGIEQCHIFKCRVGGGDAFHPVVLPGGVAVLPQQRPAVGRHLPRNNGRSASLSSNGAGKHQVQDGIKIFHSSIGFGIGGFADSR